MPCTTCGVCKDSCGHLHMCKGARSQHWVSPSITLSLSFRHRTEWADLTEQAHLFDWLMKDGWYTWTKDFVLCLFVLCLCVRQHACGGWETTWANLFYYHVGPMGRTQVVRWQGLLYSVNEVHWPSTSFLWSLQKQCKKCMINFIKWRMMVGGSLAFK